MILEGFEIENWSCIQRVAVADLPPTGVIVLHGPNGTGKSSIIEALRSCLMDDKSSTRSLNKRWFPITSSERPRISVTFRSANMSWRITKRFDSKESKLESLTPGGQWKLESADPSESHERARQMAGGCDSKLGLNQLLWLTQTDFKLPKPDKFDTGVQSRLRAVLGVFQTPLDDRFAAWVKEEWSRWFSARNKPGEKPKLKKNCSLEKLNADLDKGKIDLASIEIEYQGYERLMIRTDGLEIHCRDLRRQLAEKAKGLESLQQEYEKSLARIQGNELAAERFAIAVKALGDAKALRQKRADAERDLQESQRSSAEATREVEATSRQLGNAELRLRELRQDGQNLGIVGRESQSRLNELNQRRQSLMLMEQLKNADETLRRAEQTTEQLEKLKKEAREHPAPQPAALKKLEENRASAAQLRAQLDAAAMGLVLIPGAGAVAPGLAIDGTPELVVAASNDSARIERLVRRRAEIAIPGWGRIEINRGSNAGDLDQIEQELGELNRRFADETAPFGIAPSESNALDKLRALAAEQKVRDPEIKRLRDEIDRLLPKGLEPLRQEASRIEKLLSATNASLNEREGENGESIDAAELERQSQHLTAETKSNEVKIAALQKEIENIEREIDGDAQDGTAAVKKNKSSVGGLRKQDAAARERLAIFTAEAGLRRTVLDRIPLIEQIETALSEAEKGLAGAKRGLESTKLSESEETIEERLKAAKDGAQAIQSQLTETERELNTTKGALTRSEGLHSRRAVAAAKVEDLTRRTEQESLESDSYDRLYALFEECRDKRLNAVIDPISSRVLRWMNLLRIGGYQAIRFNDQFLPDSLIARDGATELALDEESTGTIEQIALMVRLALGSSLSTSEEPVVAMLDDPLTHSDVVRLDRMRAVLKSAAAGDPNSNPPAGPLQIFVFTCHPEWFRSDAARVVDLSNSDVMSR